MKFTSAIILTVVSLCASLCCSEEDDFIPNTINVSNDAIISVENNQNTFNVNDFIVVEFSLDNQQIAENVGAILLSDFDYGEVNQSFFFSRLSLFKETAFGTTVKIPLLEEHVDALNGEVIIDQSNNEIIQVKSVFNGVSYVCTFEIQLLETGNYYLKDTYNEGATVILEGGDYNTNYIRIQSKIINSNTDGAFEFVVN